MYVPIVHFIEHSAHNVTKDWGFSLKQFLWYFLSQITHTVLSSSFTFSLQPIQDLFLCNNPWLAFNSASFSNCLFCFCCSNFLFLSSFTCSLSHIFCSLAHFLPFFYPLLLSFFFHFSIFTLLF